MDNFTLSTNTTEPDWVAHLRSSARATWSNIKSDPVTTLDLSLLMQSELLHLLQILWHPLPQYGCLNRLGKSVTFHDMWMQHLLKHALWIDCGMICSLKLERACSNLRMLQPLSQSVSRYLMDGLIFLKGRSGMVLKNLLTYLNSYRNLFPVGNVYWYGVHSLRLWKLFCNNCKNTYQE